MQALPHQYSVSGNASASGDVTLSASGLAPIKSAPPAEFGGPGDKWSPETLLVAALADCYVLTFKAIAAASKLSWSTIDCQVDATLNKVEKAIAFTEFRLNVNLLVPDSDSVEQAERLATKTEAACLISNSLRGERQLTVTVAVG